MQTTRKHLWGVLLALMMLLTLLPTAALAAGGDVHVSNEADLRNAISDAQSNVLTTIV